MRFSFSSFSFAVLLLFTHCALGWGGEGHRITGYVAQALLTPDTRSALRALMGTDDLASIATYLDQERSSLSEKFPLSPRWHYDNWPVCDRDPNARRYCADGNCATRQIERAIQTLRSPVRSGSEKQLAVRVLVHVLGDLHQPLHMADHADRGGNDVWVQLPKRAEARRLHELWDTDFVRMVLRRRREDAFAAVLLQQFTASIEPWRAGDVSAWARESHEIARWDVYGTLPGFVCDQRGPSEVIVGKSYVDQARNLVPAQLAKAGVRIALVLNRVFSGSADRAVR